VAASTRRSPLAAKQTTFPVEPQQIGDKSLSSNNFNLAPGLASNNLDTRSKKPGSEKDGKKRRVMC
jgi:hypothetical protein